MALNAPNPSRFHSIALGRFNNFQARTDGLIGESDTTPDVSLWSLLYANNSATTVISHFDNPSEGQLVKVINIGSDLSFNGAQMILSDSSNLGVNGNIEFVYHNSSWYEAGRSHGQSSVRTAIEADSSPSVKNVKVLVIANSATQSITGFDDGHEGQLLTVICNGSSFRLDTAGTTINVGTAGAYVVLSNDAVDLVHFNGTWRLRTYAQTP